MDATTRSHQKQDNLPFILPFVEDVCCSGDEMVTSEIVVNCFKAWVTNLNSLVASQDDKERAKNAGQKTVMTQLLGIRYVLVHIS